MAVLQGVGLVLIAAVLVALFLVARKLHLLVHEVRLSREERLDQRVYESLRAEGFTDAEAREAQRESR